jgi:TPR repeat protein
MIRHRLDKTFLSAVIVICTILSTFIVPLTSFAATIAVDTDNLNKAQKLIRTKHYHQAYARFETMAKHGCPFSQCILGIMNQRGLGVKKNSPQALHWFQESAKQGFADAEHRLGLMYYNGEEGVAKDLGLAKQWLTRAAQHGAVEANQFLEQIPEEQAISSNIAQLPQNAAITAETIHRSWQGYSDVTKQLDQLVSAASTH